MRPNRRLHFRTLASSTPHVACSRRQAPTSPSVCSSRRVLRLRARPRGVVARRPLAGARGRAPRGSGPLDANEAGGWRVFTTRVSALEDRTVIPGRCLTRDHRCDPPLAPLSPPPISPGTIEPIAPDAGGRRDRFCAPPREKAARVPRSEVPDSPGHRRTARARIGYRARGPLDPLRYPDAHVMRITEARRTALPFIQGELTSACAPCPRPRLESPFTGTCCHRAGFRPIAMQRARFSGSGGGLSTFCNTYDVRARAAGRRPRRARWRETLSPLRDARNRLRL